MRANRKIIEIDEERCDGCGRCILSCAEGALAIVDGKARLVGEIYCDGIGACLGDCPQAALKLVEREADNFDEAAVEKRLHWLEGGKREAAATGGCPGSRPLTLIANPPEVTIRTPAGGAPSREDDPTESCLGQWPIKLQLLGPNAPFLHNADLVLLADCVAAAYPALHQDILAGHVVAMGCPKLDDLPAHTDRLTEILKHSGVRSLTVVHMEVPCCRGFVVAAQRALEASGKNLPLQRKNISIRGKLLEEETL